MKFQIKQGFKMLSQHVIFPLVYLGNRWRKIKPKQVILADAHHSSCPPKMLPIRKRLSEEGFIVKECCCDATVAGQWQSFRTMLHFMRLYAESGTVIICDNYLPVSSCRKKKGTRVIQLWHGCGAFKRFGYDALDDIPKGYIGNVYRNYDLVTVSSKACIPFFKSAMGIRKNGVVQALGVSDTDRLLDEEYRESCRKRFYELHPKAKGKQVVLWAPSFRGNAGEAAEQKYLPGERELQEQLGNRDFYFIKSYHPHSRGAKKDKGMNTDEMMICADLLITDYSSVFFEYLLLDRPILFYAPDLQDYTKDRGFYLDYEALPGEIVTEPAKIGAAVERILKEEAPEMAEKRRRFRRQYMEACDGNATERILAVIRENKHTI